jgi:hypothetical protein
VYLDEPVTPTPGLPEAATALAELVDMIGGAGG